MDDEWCRQASVKAFQLQAEITEEVCRKAYAKVSRQPLCIQCMKICSLVRDAGFTFLRSLLTLKPDCLPGS